MEIGKVELKVLANTEELQAALARVMAASAELDAALSQLSSAQVDLKVDGPRGRSGQEASTE